MDWAIVIGLIVVAVVMFSFERVPLEVGSLTIVLALALTGVLTPQEAFAGFSNGTVIFIFTLLAMTQGLAATGVMQLAGRRADFVGHFGERAFVAVLMVLVAAFSSIASNTAVTAAFLPVATAAAARARIPASRVLMPLAHGSMLGGMILLYGTSTNLVVSEALAGFGMPRIGFTELAKVGLPLTLVAIAWTLFIGRHLLPRRVAPSEDAPLTQREYVTEASLTERSRFLGRPMSALSEGLGLPVLGAVRGDRWLTSSAERLQAGDRLVLRGSRDAILQVKDLRSMVLHAEFRLTEPARPRRRETLAEALVPDHSPLVGLSLADSRFSERFGLNPLAIHRHPAIESLKHMHLLRPVLEGRTLRHVPISAGDVLLLSGPRAQFGQLDDGHVLLVLGDVPYSRPKYGRALLATAIFAASVGVAAANLVEPALAGLAGMLTMIATGCVESSLAFRVEWRIVLLIGSLLALGQAMEKSGTGELLAGALVSVASGAGPRVLLLLVMVLTVLLSAPMSNQAAALVVLPIAIHVAQQVGVEPRTFAMGTCLAASCSFLTPLEPSAALVYGPGHYRFVDFLRVGAPLTVLMLALLTLVVPIAWPLR